MADSAAEAVTGPLAAALAGRYTVTRELGRGGMATVYLAHDIKHDREVAIKVLHEQLAHELGAERFLTEIRTTARLRHPHILPLFDSGAVGTLLYYVMPFIDGVSLRERLTRDGALAVDEAVRIATEVAEALEHAHAHGVIHRDIKPENILLDSGHALVADFGIARAMTATDSARMTQTGMALGTPAYMSPEQSAGDRDVDARSDLYSVASVLFEMLTGEPPFTGPTIESILVQRFTKTPPRVTAKRPAVPHHVDAAVHTAMARDPAERFASMARFAAALVARAPRTDAGGGAKSIAVLPFANMSADPENEYFSDGIAEEIINALAQLPGLRVAARTSAFSFKGKNEDLRGIGDALNVETVLEGSVRKAGNRVRVTAQLINVADGYHLWSERYDRELTDIFEIQDEIASSIATKLKVTLGAGADSQLVRPPTANVEAYELVLKGRRLVRLRGRSIFEGMEFYERAIGLDPAYAAAHAGLAAGLVLMAFWGLIHPGKVGERARAAANRSMELDPSLVDSQAAAALVALTVDLDFDRAQALWDRYPPLDPANVDAHVQRASFGSYTSGVRDFGIAELRAAVAADPLNAYPVAQLSIVLAFARRLPEARIEAERAVAIDPASTYTHWAMIHVCAHEEDVEKTRRAFDEASARFGRTPWFLMALALSVRNSADRSLAEAIHDEMVARSRYEYLQPAAIGSVAFAAGRLEAALGAFREAARIRDPLFIAIARDWPLLDGIRRHAEWAPMLREAGYTRLIPHEGELPPLSP